MALQSPNPGVPTALQEGDFMTERSPGDVTGLLQDWRCGDEAALDRIITLVHDELHRLAHACMMGERPDHTLQTSALVNEAYLRLIDANQVEWKDRAHFLAISAVVMRRILVQFARSRAARKRGGGALKVVFDEIAIPAADRGADLAALDDALIALAEIDPREAKVVELRFFGGLSEKEAAEVLGISDRTVRHDWNHAKAWLLAELKRGA
jgi:RNA polymerase sigma factor (TIGR02999 family)